MAIEIAKPFTPAQRRLFHEVEENPDAARRHGMTRAEGRRLADEADDYARRGKEKADAKHPGGDTDKENRELATKTPKKASFIDIGHVFRG